MGGVPAPNPDYPQDIHVVTGNNTIEITGKNKLPTQKSMWESGHYNTTGDKATNANRMRLINLLKVKPNTTYRVRFTSLIIRAFGANQTFLRDVGIKTPGSTFTTDADCYYLAISVDIVYSNYNENSDKLALLLNTETDLSYEPYYHVEYPLNLGNIELCKIGDYQDFIFENTPDSEYYDSSLVENGWYKFGNIDKYVYNNDITSNSTTESMIGMLTPVLNVEASLTYTQLALKSYCNIMPTTVIENTGLAGTTSTKKIRVDISTDYASTYDEAKALYAQKNLIIYYVVETPTTTQITDTTLIEQLENIYNKIKLTKGINHITVTASDLAPYMELSYMQDLPSKLDNLTSRIALLE